MSHINIIINIGFNSYSLIIFIRLLRKKTYSYIKRHSYIKSHILNIKFFFVYKKR
jgi:hypothetical protein